MAYACARASVACAADETGTGNDLNALSLAQLMEMNIHSVYGASKYRQRTSQAPSSISIVTSEEIRRFGYTTVADVLNNVRGIYATNDRNYTYLGIRGFLSPGDYTTRVLVLIDGHRLNDNIYDSGSVGRESMIDVDVIDRIEVIRGPSSSLYGSSAFLGVVNVITKRGRDVDGREISFDVGSDDTYRTRASYGKTFANGVDWLGSASYYTSGGSNFYYPEFDQRRSDNRFASNNGVASGLDDESALKLFSGLHYGDFSASAYFSNRHKQIPTASFETIFNDPEEKTHDQRAYLELGYKHALTDATTLQARSSYDIYQYDGTFPYDYSLPGDPPDHTLYVDDTTGEWVDTELQLTMKLNDRYTFVVGGEYRENIQEAQKAYDDIDPRSYYVNQSEHSDVWGVFAQVEARLRDDFSLTGGLRYDHYGQAFGSTTNPRFAAIYNPTPESALKLMYGEAFRAPNPFERYYLPEQGQRTPLWPETIRTYELAYELSLDQTYRLSASTYLYLIEGLISQAAVPSADGIRVERYYANLDDVRQQGVALEIQGNYRNGAIVRASWLIQRSRNEQTREELTSSPRHLAKFLGSVPAFGTPVFANVSVQYISESWTLRRSHSPSFVVTDFTLNSHDLWQRFELIGGVYNVFNVGRLFPTAEEHVQATLQQPGRTYGLRIIMKF